MLDYLRLFMSSTGFAPEDQAFVLDAAGRLDGAGELEAALEAYRAGGYTVQALEPWLPELERVYGVRPFTSWLLVLMLTSREAYARSRDPELFWATFTDIRYKVEECKALYGYPGVFVGFWYPIFFVDSIVKLGRLEFETGTYPGHSPVTVGNLTVKPGDPAYSIHIPASGEPFTREARLDAYARAYDHFGCAAAGVPLVCFCESWLLYPPYTDLLPDGSRIRDFAGDFCHIYGEQTREFDDDWRAFGVKAKLPPQAWPEDSSLQRALKTHFTSGGKPGFGMGLLIYDGKQLWRAE